MKLTKSLAKLTTVLALAALLMLLAAPAAMAARQQPAPPPAPVAIDAVCLERDGVAWKVAGECNRAYVTVEFDGVTEHPAYFLTDHVGLPGGTNYALVLLGYSGLHPWQYPTNSVPVTLTGDGSVSVCIADNGTLRAPSDPDCVIPAVI